LSDDVSPRSGPSEIESPQEPPPKKSRAAMYQHRLKNSQLLTEEQLQEMFTTYCTMPNYSYVARVCGCHLSTVRRYAKSQNWEERRQKVLTQARDKADYGILKATEQSLLMLRALKAKITQKIQSLNATDLPTENLVHDFERLVKLEQILLGGVSDRQEHQLTTHEERIRKLRESRGFHQLNA